MRQTNTEEYANGLAQMSNWKSTVTIRPSYKLKAHTSDKLIERISKRLRTRVFYTMEKDWNDEMYHLQPIVRQECSKQTVKPSKWIKPESY